MAPLGEARAKKVTPLREIQLLQEVSGTASDGWREGGRERGRGRERERRKYRQFQCFFLQCQLNMYTSTWAYRC